MKWLKKKTVQDLAWGIVVCDPLPGSRGRWDWGRNVERGEGREEERRNDRRREKATCDYR